MASSGAIGAFIGSFLTDLIPVVILLSIIIIIVSYEAIDLLIKSGKGGKKGNKNRNDSLISPDTKNATTDECNDLNKTNFNLIRRKRKTQSKNLQ